MRPLNIAIAGATGAVGEAFQSILEERDFPVGDLRLLASHRSAGRVCRFRDRKIGVEVVDDFDFSDTQVALFSAGGSVSEAHAPRAAIAGAVVVDNTSHFRYMDHVPLVVPEVNGHRIGDGLNFRIIANPNCSTIQLVVALKPIYDAVGIRRINVATYQAVSGAGRRGIAELSEQTIQVGEGHRVSPTVAPVQIAFNAVPQIGGFQSNGYTLEEMKMVWETRKILEDETIEINPTCVRVPVYLGHSEAVHVETVDPITDLEARQLLRQAEGVRVIDERRPGGYPTATEDAGGKDPVYVGRIRQDLHSSRGLNFWVVCDNVRKGAALNSIQIAERLVPLLTS